MKRDIKRICKTSLILYMSLTTTACKEELAALGTVTAIIAAIPFMPFVKVYHSIFGVGRTLFVTRVYKSSDGKIAIENSTGWFTEERRDSQSAWVIDMNRCEKDKKGRIILSESNLDTSFFKDRDLSEWSPILHYESDEQSDYYSNDSDFKSITIHNKNGDSQVFYLKQSGNYPQR